MKLVTFEKDGRSAVGLLNAAGTAVHPVPGCAGMQALIGIWPVLDTAAVLHQRQTEISVLNGAIARYGERLGVPTPFNTVITKVISCIQNNYDKQYLG